MKKIRAILLLEVDFNAVYKIIFNGRIIPRLEETNTIPYEIIGSRRAQAVIYLVLNKKLISDIAKTHKLLTAVIYADVTTYYDRVAPPFVSLCMQYFRLEVTCLLVLFKII